MLTYAKQVVVEQVCPRVLTEMVDSKYISFFFFLFFFFFSSSGSSDGFFNRGLSAAVCKSKGTVPEASYSLRTFVIVGKELRSF